MSTHPYIPLYVDDYDAATAHLSVEEDGAYSRLLRLCWRTPGCSLPNDPAWIARKIRLSPEDFARVAQPVLDEFFKLARGRLVQKRLRDEYDDISRKKSARKNAGKKGGDAKARKTKDIDPSNASDLPGYARAFPEPNPEPEPEVSSEDKSSGAAGAELSTDPDKATWDLALQVLGQQGRMTEPRARVFFGKLLRDNRLTAKELLPAVGGAFSNQTQDPAAYLTRAAAGVAKRRSETAQPSRQGFV